MLLTIRPRDRSGLLRHRSAGRVHSRQTVGRVPHRLLAIPTVDAWRVRAAPDALARQFVAASVGPAPVLRMRRSIPRLLRSGTRVHTQRRLCLSRRTVRGRMRCAADCPAACTSRTRPPAPAVSTSSIVSSPTPRRAFSSTHPASSSPTSSRRCKYADTPARHR